MNNFMFRLIARFNDREEGQGLVEYAVILGVIVVGLIVVWQATDVDLAVKATLEGIVTALGG